MPAGPNPRFIVTSLKREQWNARALYEDFYCACGDMENRIKEQQLDLFADRTSTATMKTNQLRLWFASMAYVLVNRLRELALVTLSVRRVKIAMASGCPYQNVFAHAYDGARALKHGEFLSAPCASRAAGDHACPTQARRGLPSTAVGA